MKKHISVLLDEALFYLDVKDDGIYVDATVGYAGHSGEILKRNKKGFLFAFDKDSTACSYSDDYLKNIGDNYKIFNTSYKNIKKTLENEGIFEVDGILFDLGVSSPEIDEAERGFSYIKDAPLDMRMDTSKDFTAKDVVNDYSKEELTKIFRIYGEEKYAMRIANNIISKREQKRIETTLELANIISEVIPYKDKKNGSCCKKVFQAIRIEVNNELEEMEIALEDAIKMLKVGGTIVVISFHSLEDRICKQKFKKYTMVDPVIKGMPNIDDDLLPDYELVTNSVITPTIEEIEFNKRSKSAKMRVLKRIKRRSNEKKN